MTVPIMNHKRYTKAICDIAGVLFGLVNNEPQPTGRRGVLERMRVALEEALAEPEQPPEMPRMCVEYHVETSNGEDLWCHHPVAFKCDAEAYRWALESMTRWQRIRRVEIGYKLVVRPEEE